MRRRCDDAGRGHLTGITLGVMRRLSASSRSSPDACAGVGKGQHANVQCYKRDVSIRNLLHHCYIIVTREVLYRTAIWRGVTDEASSAFRLRRLGPRWLQNAAGIEDDGALLADA